MTDAEFEDGYEADAWDADAWDLDAEATEFDDHADDDLDAADDLDDDADDDLDDDADDDLDDDAADDLDDDADDDLDDDADDDAADEFGDDDDAEGDLDREGDELDHAFDAEADVATGAANSVVLDSLDSNNRVIFERMKCGDSWTAAEKAKIHDVIRVVRRYAEQALSAARRLNTKMLKRRLKERWKSRPFGTFFGTGWFTRGRVRRIRRRVIRIAGLLLNSFRLVKVPTASGSCNGRCWRGSFSGAGATAAAYTTGGGKRRIYLCPRYFTDGAQFSTSGRSTDAMARTLVHEMVHEIGYFGHRKLPGGGRVSTAQTASELARKKPLRPGTNPESYAWFFFYNANLKQWKRHKKANLI